MKSITRTVRFDEEDSNLIDRFLKANPLFDFSTLARLAIKSFILNPNMKIEPVSSGLLCEQIEVREE